MPERWLNPKPILWSSGDLCMTPPDHFPKDMNNVPIVPQCMYHLAHCLPKTAASLRTFEKSEISDSSADALYM